MSLPLWFSFFNQTSIRTEVLVAKGRGGFLAAESSSPFRSSQRCSVHRLALDVASLTRSPPSFRGPCTQGHPRCFSCSVSSPGSSSTLLPCWGLPAPRFLPPLHRRPSPPRPSMNLCQSIEESTLICLSGKGIDCKVVSSLNRRKRWIGQTSSGWGQSLSQVPGICRQPLWGMVIRCHAFATPSPRAPLHRIRVLRREALGGSVAVGRLSPPVPAPRDDPRLHFVVALWHA